MDSIEYEEWALKGIDQVLGPSIQRLLSRSHQTAPDAHTHVSVLYPPSLISRPSVLESLQRMSTHRAPLHNRQFLYNMVAIPVTAPLFLVPAIPNVVTYYFIWRAWSHWRAYQALQSLQSLIRHDLVKFEPDEQLDALFQHSRPPPSDLSTDCAWLLDQSCMNRIVDDYILPHKPTSICDERPSRQYTTSFDLVLHKALYRLPVTIVTSIMPKIIQYFMVFVEATIETAPSSSSWVLSHLFAYNRT